MKKLNVNENVIVKLSEYGKYIWEHHADVSGSRFHDPILYDSIYNREMKKLKEDTLEAPLWEIMRVYGEHLESNEEEYPFKSDIMIKEKSLY